MSRGTLACLLGRSFPFPSLIGIFPSFCQALAEDRVTTPTKKKKKHGTSQPRGASCHNLAQVEAWPPIQEVAEAVASPKGNPPF